MDSPVSTMSYKELTLTNAAEPVAFVPAATVSKTRERSPEDIVQVVLSGPRRRQQGCILRIRIPGDTSSSQAYSCKSLADHSTLELQCLSFKQLKDKVPTALQLKFDRGDLLVSGGVRAMQIDDRLFIGIATPRGSVFLIRFLNPIADGNDSTVFGDSWDTLNRNPNSAFQTSRFELPGSDSSADATWLVNCAEWKVLQDGRLHLTVGSTNGSIHSLLFNTSTYPSAPSVTNLQSTSSVSKLFTGIVKRAMGSNQEENSYCVAAVGTLEREEEVFVFTVEINGRLSVWSLAHQKSLQTFPLTIPDIETFALESATLRLVDDNAGPGTFRLALVCQVSGRLPHSWYLRGTLDSSSSTQPELVDSNLNFISAQPDSAKICKYGVKLADMEFWGPDLVVTFWWDELEVGASILAQHHLGSDSAAGKITMQLSSEKEDWNRLDGLLAQKRQWDEVKEYAVSRLMVPGRYTPTDVSAAAKRVFGLTNLPTDSLQGAIHHISSYILRSSALETRRPGPARETIRVDVAIRMWLLLLGDCSTLLDENTQPLSLSLPGTAPLAGEPPKELVTLLRTNSISMMHCQSFVESVVDSDALVTAPGSERKVEFLRLCSTVVEANWEALVDFTQSLSAHQQGPEGFLQRVTKRCALLADLLESPIDAFVRTLPSSQSVSVILHQLADQLFGVTEVGPQPGPPGAPSFVGNQAVMGPFTCKALAGAAKSNLRASLGALVVLLYLSRISTSCMGATYLRSLRKPSRDALDHLLFRGAVVCHNLAFALVLCDAGVSPAASKRTIFELPPAVLAPESLRLAEGANAMASAAAAPLLQHLAAFTLVVGGAHVREGQSVPELVRAAAQQTMRLIHQNVSLELPGSVPAGRNILLVLRDLGQSEYLMHLIGYVACIRDQRCALDQSVGHDEWWRTLELIDAESRLRLLLDSRDALPAGELAEEVIAIFHRCAPDDAAPALVVEYYLALAKSLEQLPLHNAAAKLAVSALAVASDANAKSSLQSVLSSNIFTFAINGDRPDYRLALHAVLSQTEESLRLQYVRQLTALLMERRCYEALCALPFVEHPDLLDEVRRSIFAKAEWTQVRDVSGISVFHVLHMFCFSNGNYLGAADAMYRYAVRLEAAAHQVALDTPEARGGRVPSSLKELLGARVNALAACAGALRLLAPERRVLMIEQAREGEMEVQDGEPLNIVRPVDSGHVQKEYMLTQAMLRLLENEMSPFEEDTPTGLEARAASLLPLLLKQGCEEEAINICAKFDLDFEPNSGAQVGVFGTIAKKCAESYSDAGPEWELLRALLEKFDVVHTQKIGGGEVELRLFKYHTVVLETFLQHAQRIGQGPTGDLKPIPEWLLRSFKSWCKFTSTGRPTTNVFAGGESHPVVCIELLFRYNRLLEATNLFRDMIPSAEVVRDDLDSFIKQAAWIPVNLFDNLVGAIDEECQSTDTQAATILKEAKEKLEAKLKAFFKVVVKTQIIGSAS